MCCRCFGGAATVCWRTCMSKWPRGRPWRAAVQYWRCKAFVCTSTRTSDDFSSNLTRGEIPSPWSDNSTGHDTRDPQSAEAHVPGQVWQQSRDLSRDHLTRYCCAQDRRNLVCRSSIAWCSCVFQHCHWRKRLQVCGCRRASGQGALGHRAKLAGGADGQGWSSKTVESETR